MINNIKIQKIDNFSFDTIRQNFLSSYSENEGAILLDSCSDERESQNNDYSYLFLDPIAKYSFKNGQLEIETKDSQQKYEGNAFDLIEENLFSRINNNLESPCIAGYFSYELLHEIESIQKAELDLLNIPLYCLYLYATVLKIPRDQKKKIKIYNINYQNQASLWKEKFNLEKLKIDTEHRNEELKLQKIGVGDLVHSNFSKEKYIFAVKEIINLIKQGEVYQVNLSQQLQFSLDKKVQKLFSNLCKLCRGEYSAYLKIDDFYILSSSPELFLSIDNNKITTSPIKGTRKTHIRNNDKIINELQNSEKDLAELSMIVDVERNDLNKISNNNTVRVKKHAWVNSLTYVHHLVSNIQAKIKENTTITDIIKATFPSGSISGAPKISAMDKIAKLEKITRGVYTGSIGFFNSNRDLTLNVAIRTLTIKNNTVYFNSGGGITIDSDPEKEFEETLDKANGINSEILATKKSD